MNASSVIKQYAIKWRITVFSFVPLWHNLTSWLGIRSVQHHERVDLLTHLLLEGLIKPNIHNLKLAGVSPRDKFQHGLAIGNFRSDCSRHVTVRRIKDEHGQGELRCKRAPHFLNPLQHFVLIHPGLVLDGIMHDIRWISVVGSLLDTPRVDLPGCVREIQQQ